MNIRDVLEYIYKNIPFIDEHAPELYRKVGLTKHLLLGLCHHPSPLHIPKARKKILFQLHELIATRKLELLGGTNEYINEIIVEAQRVNHKRPHQFNLRKRWTPA